MSTRVSIIMTNYNHADFLPAAIESVRAQTFTDWELFVLDDCSTDTSATIVTDYAMRDPRIHFLPNAQNMGITRNRNRMWKLPLAEYSAILDSDDMWHDREKLTRQVSYLDIHPSCVLLGTQAQVIDVQGLKIDTLTYSTDDGAVRASILRRNPFVYSSVVMRTVAARSAGAYDEKIPVWEDYDHILRLCTLGTCANLPEILTSYRRIHSSATGTAGVRGAQTHLTIIRRYAHNYPGFYSALLKAYARILRAFLKR